LSNQLTIMASLHSCPTAQAFKNVDVLRASAGDAIKCMRWNPSEGSVYPLILKREPTSYVGWHSVTLIVPTSNEHYSSLLKLVNNWYIDIPAGQFPIKIDATGKHDLDEMEKKRWYIVDIREKVDTKIPNRIELPNYSKLDTFAREKLANSLIEKSKSLVIFADKVGDVPDVWTTMSVWGLTAGTSKDLFDLLYFGCMDSPQGLVTIKRKESILSGYHRFEAAPVMVNWPANY
jgi:hypothetical protein